MRRPELASLARLIAPLSWAGVAAITASFLWSGLEGARGLGALAEAQASAERLEDELARLRAERRAAENRVRRLGDAYLDLDLLDERARSVLGLVRPDEIVIPPVYQ